MLVCREHQYGKGPPTSKYTKKTKCVLHASTQLLVLLTVTSNYSTEAVHNTIPNENVQTKGLDEGVQSITWTSRKVRKALVSGSQRPATRNLQPVCLNLHTQAQVKGLGNNTVHLSPRSAWCARLVLS